MEAVAFDKQEEHQYKIKQVYSEVGKVVVGQEYMVNRLMIGLFTNGHILLEGVPGLAKTLTVSTLAQVLAGRDGYEVVSGSVTYRGQDLLALEPEQRAREGVFLAFQYPVEIPGVNNAYLLKAALNALRKHRGLQEVDAFEFLAVVRDKMKLMKMDESFLNRSVNAGFSGGEKKRNEILQMAILEPALALLDETDSGLDIDALQVVAEGVNSLRGPERAIVMITHYQRLLDYIQPDFVHVLSGGKIVKSGDKSLALELERRGYDWVRQAVA